MKFRYFIFVAYLVANFTHADDVYLAAAEQQFEKLMEQLPEDQRHDWRNRNFNDVMEHSKKLQELEKTQAYIRSQINSKELESILAFSYLADAMQNKLQQRTKLTNDLGRHMYSVMSEDVEVIRDEIEVELVSLQNVSGAIQLQRKLSSYFALQRRLEQRQEHPPILRAYDFRPQKSAWDDHPVLVEKFVLYNWPAAIKMLSEDKKELQSIKDSFVSFNYLRLKDPIAFVSLGCQLAVLLIAVAGYLISYTHNPSIKVVTSLVFLSMFSSVVLVFVSASTVLNLFLQAVVPGAFIFYWTYQKRITNQVSVASGPVEPS